ncbi:MAG: response regulator [Planctomycetes bacterium]|jgi:signal transduction histidine kinase/CheY-like chemotaxis protein|nr:response regulator [Planctomycetota bacterium]
MTTPPPDELQQLRERLSALAAENAQLRRQAEGVADANARAAMQLLELSEQRQHELELKNAEIESALQVAETASDEKSRFLATISHELRTPISGIIGLCELLLDSRRLADAHEFGASIAKSAEGFLELINQLLDFCKLEADKVELEAVPYDLWDVVESVAELLHIHAERKGLAFHFELGACVPRHVLGDPLRLRQVLLNLGSNAVKFTDHGAVHLTVLPTANDPHRCVLRFEDTGCGFDEAAAARLFQPFVQADATMARRYGGTGLGLAIARQLVELMGGRLTWHSTPGRGSTFAFDLPLLQSPACLLPPAAARGTVRLDGFAADSAVLRTVQAHLERRGFAVDVLAQANGTAPVLTLATTSADDGQGIAMLRRHHPEPMPLLVLAPAGFRIGDAELLRPELTAVLRQPLRPSRLLAAVEALLGHQLTRAATAAPATPDSFPGLRVLVAEDTNINRRVAVEQLRRLGCAVDEARDGNEALAKVREQHFDLVLMDLQMPGLDGFGATKAIRTLEQGTPQRTPIVALTANAMPGDREDCLLAGMDGYLSKPVRKDQLAALLARWTRTPGPPRP